LEEYEDWHENLKLASNSTNFFDYYEIVGDLGKGQFGLV
jgi:hypothetical protein